MAHVWKKMKRKTIIDYANDDVFVAALTDSERDAMQLDLCRRFNWIFIKPDGTVPAVPVTGPGDEV